MDSKNIIQNALTLSPAERVFIIDALSQSLSEPNKNIDTFWKEEVENRYKAFMKGEIKTISYKKNLK